MACLCERMYPNFAMFCQHTEFANPRIYKDILDSIWEILTVKSAKVNFEKQLEKLEDIIPSPEDFDFYAVYPAEDACEALSLLLHALLDRDLLTETVQKISTLSVETVKQLEEAQGADEITDSNQKENEAVCTEWDVQWAIYRPLKECEERDIHVIRDLRDELRENLQSNIGVELNG